MEQASASRSDSAGDAQAAIGGRIRLIGIAALVVALIAILLGNVVGNEQGEEGGVGYLILFGILNALLAGGIFLWLLPTISGAVEKYRPALWGIGLGAAAVIAVFVYWTGFVFVLGPAAVVAGMMSRGRGSEGTPSMIALGLGAGTTVAGLLILLFTEVL
ncbi:MAG: hypothetical protein ACR2NA_08315 [Solirubrobacterales bacterium]